MSYIPKNAKWYVADLIERLVIQGAISSVVHRNLVLVRADSPEQAYIEAMALGKEGEDEYLNEERQSVRAVFVGLGDLNVIHDELVHGAELIFREYVGLSDQETESMVRTKEELAIFRPITQTKGPDYASGEVLMEARDLVQRGSKP